MFYLKTRDTFTKQYLSLKRMSTDLDDLRQGRHDWNSQYSRHGTEYYIINEDGVEID